jgi:hypothetical protein
MWLFIGYQGINLDLEKWNWISSLHQTLQILWVMNCSGGKFTVTHNNYDFYQNYYGL